jgi:hypothetical protein|tara:strand:- start:100 stop:582 length:483 start_codon:yes stop_codon:yes gene_type:complete
MSLIVSNTAYIDGFDLWEASIDPLPNLDYENLDYIKISDDRYYCTDVEALSIVTDCFDSSVINEKISEPFTIAVEIQKNLPNFELIPHLDNKDMLGVIIINLLDSGTSTKFFDTNDIEIGQAPTTVSNGIMYLNNWNFKHGYINSGNKDRYIAICIIYKK